MSIFRVVCSVAAITSLAGCLGNMPSGLSKSANNNNSSNSSVTAQGAVDPGSVTLHRLNRTEYNNTVRDLLGTQQQPANAFTADPTANGFDNNADALTLSTVDLQYYEAAAESLATEVINPNKINTLAPCAPKADPNACINNFATAFGKRAWRRPMSDAEVTMVTTIATSTAGDTYAQQVEKALVTMLMSPYFIFRVELDPNPNSITVHPLTSYELAARLSYFLWSSTPDDELLEAADSNILLTDEGLTAQVTRMVADPKATAITQNFAGQWLELRATQALAPDPNYFPEFNETLRSAMLAQTEAVFNDLLSGAEPLSSLFTSDTTYINDTLAKFYGMTAVGNANMTKVAAGSRKGLLTQAAILAATSFPSRTSLVRRGEYVMGQLLCAPPPPPPPNVPQLPSNSANIVTQRQRLENHVTSAACAACHNLMDPYGFVLESFDGIGAFRTTDNGGTIDTTATLSDGTKVSNVSDLTAVLAVDPRIPKCAVQQLFTYALGRGLTASDTATMASLQSDFLNNGQRLNTLINEIVFSDAFRMRRGAN